MRFPRPPLSLPILLVTVASVFAAAFFVTFVGWPGRDVTLSPEAVAVTEPDPNAEPVRGAAATPFPEWPACEPETTVAFIGDVMLSRSVGATMRTKKDWGWPWHRLTDWLTSADLAFANLETSVTPGREVQPMEMLFRADPEAAAAMARSGIDIVSLANNHVPNFGAAGLRDTLDYLTEAGVLYVGAGRDDAEAWRPVYVTAGALTFAFVAGNDSDVVPASYGAAADRPGTALLDVGRIKDAVAEARQNADVVVFSMHAGREYVVEQNERQVAYAHAAVDAGADLVIGHHAHVVQRMEVYRGRPILYGLGNFIFDQTWSRDTQEGLAVRAVFFGKTLSRLEFLPVEIVRDYQPHPAAPEAAGRIIGRLGQATREEPVLSWDSAGFEPVQEVRHSLTLADAGGCRTMGGVAQAGNLEAAVVDGRLVVRRGGVAAWTSPDDIWVDAFMPSSAREAASLSGLAVAYGADGLALPASFSWDEVSPQWTVGEPLAGAVCAAVRVDDVGFALLVGGVPDGKRCVGNQVVVLRVEDGGYVVSELFQTAAAAGLSSDSADGRPFVTPRLAP
jgi:poly-gamma-glutamate synthesis protein (capsule biosynthesis protein)